MAVRHRKPDYAIVAAVIAGVIVIAGSTFASPKLREPLIQRPERLPLSFPHRKHLDIACTKCHHNFKDRALKNKYVGTPCVLCHKSDIPELKRGIEAEFHDFCKSCHAQEARFLKKHGPVRECTPCHTATEDGFLP